jgi:hypothetical protein
MSSRWGTTLLAAIVVVLPIATTYVLPSIPSLRAPEPVPVLHAPVDITPRSFEKTVIGPQASDPEWITNVQIVDFDRDGVQDVIACDARRNGVFWCRQNPKGAWQDQQIGFDLLAPAHATPVDFDGDADLDVLVSVLGNIDPDDDVIGSVVLLENRGGEFAQHLLLDDVRRVADVQPADFDGDQDLDLAVAVFGYNRGQVLWLENRGELRFRKHELLSAAGTIHVPVADYDGDGDPDIASVVSQESEEVWTFENEGGGTLTPHRVFQSLNFDLGTAGLVQSDLDSDGDVDLILPAGDNLEDIHSFPQPYHGCYWLENLGEWKFTARKIADLGGTYAAAVDDLDNDGDRDLVLVSMLGDGSAARPSLVWCENDGSQKFRTWRIDTSPVHLVTVAVGDLDGDGGIDIVAGSLDVMSPLDEPQRITAWMNRGK